MARRDCVKDCLTPGVTLEHLQETHCFRCYQPECTRSLHRKTKFDDRVLHWEERLFTDVPRMDPSDPRFQVIQGQQFKMFTPPPPGKQGSWDDPRDLKPTTVQVPEDIRPPVNEAQAPLAVFPPEPPPPRILSTTLTQDVVLINTPRQEGVMLRGGPTPEAKPASRDPWEAPAPVGSNEKLVKRGARIQLGTGVEGGTPAAKPNQGDSK